MSADVPTLPARTPEEQFEAWRFRQRESIAVNSYLYKVSKSAFLAAFTAGWVGGQAALLPLVRRAAQVVHDEMCMPRNIDPQAKHHSFCVELYQACGLLPP